MGTIAQKLEYLNDTRLLLKDNINKINNVLDDNSTFRSYPQELFNGYLDILNNGTDTLWNNLEKVSASGEEATLENVETAPIKMVLNGNTSQDTTSGIQLFDISKVVTNWNDGKGVKNNNDGTLTVHPPTTSSSTSASSPNTLKDYCPTLQVGDVVYLNATTTGTSKYIYLLTSASVWAFKSARTITQNDLDSRVLWYASGNDTEATISDIIISKTNTTILEKYTGGQPSPSPDYPQEVKVVKGNNVVSVQGKNSFDLTKHTNTLDANTTIISANEYTCNVVPQWRGRVIVPISNFKNNTDYTFSYTSSSPRAYLNGIKGIKDGFATTLYTGAYYQYAQKVTINTSDYDEIEIDLYARGNGGTTTDVTISNLQFEEGSTASEYTPYSKTDYTINLGNIELCKIGDYKDYLFKRNGKWYVHKEIGKVVLDGSESGWQKRGSSTNSYIIIQRSFRVGGNICMSDKFIYSGSYDGQFEHILVNSSWNENLITIDTSRLTENSLNGAKQWLSANQPNMYYPLATPTEEEITDTTIIEQLEAISKAKSVKDKTYITQTNEELPFILNVEAIKEYEVN